jgi:hypothetical protein
MATQRTAARSGRTEWGPSAASTPSFPSSSSAEDAELLASHTYGKAHVRLLKVSSGAGGGVEPSPQLSRGPDCSCPGDGTGTTCAR